MNGFFKKRARFCYNRFMAKTKIPYFSVIVPVYGAEKFIRKCVDSILAQTFTDFELILVDDGSRDKCPAILDEYAAKDKRVKVIHKENGGAVSARKEGCRAAKGEYIANVDADDWLAVDYLEKFYMASQTGADMICCGSVWWNDDEDFTNYWMPYQEGLYEREDIEDCLFPDLIENDHNQTFMNVLWSKVFKRQMFVPLQEASDSAIKMSDDLVVVKPFMYKAQKIYIIDQYLYSYRYNPVSLTHSVKTYSWENPKLVGKALESLIPMEEFDFEAQLYRNIVHGVFNVALSRFYLDKPVKEIYAEIIEGISDPYYQNAISKVKFAFATKGWFAAFALKHKLLWIIRKFAQRRKGM